MLVYNKGAKKVDMERLKRNDNIKTLKRYKKRSKRPKNAKKAPNKQIRGVYVNTSKSKVKEYKFSKDVDELEMLRYLCSCEYITCLHRRICNIDVDVFAPENPERSFKNMSMVKFNKFGKVEEIIFGNLFICSHTHEGKLKSLSIDNINAILKSSCYKIGGQEILVIKK